MKARNSSLTLISYFDCPLFSETKGYNLIKAAFKPCYSLNVKCDRYRVKHDASKKKTFSRINNNMESM